MKKYFGYVSILLGIIFLCILAFDKIGIPFTLSGIIAIIGIGFGIFGIKYEKISSLVGIAINLGGLLHILALVFSLG